MIDTVCEYAAFPFLGHVDLSKENILKLYLSKSYRRSLPQALQIVAHAYETPARETPDSNSVGLIFPIQPEVLAYGMQLVNARDDEMHVCEIACSTGDNGLLLALAGAKN
jgi:hypothetical protein